MATCSHRALCARGLSNHHKQRGRDNTGCSAPATNVCFRSRVKKTHRIDRCVCLIIRTCSKCQMQLRWHRHNENHQ